MEGIQTVINALVVGAVGLVLARLTTNLRQEMRAEVGRLDDRLQSFRAEWKQEGAELRSEIRELRSDLTRVALAVGAERRAGRP